MEKSYTIATELYTSEPQNTPLRYISGDQETYPLGIKLLTHGTHFEIPRGATVQLNFTDNSKGKHLAFAEVVDGEQSLIHYVLVPGDLTVPGKLTVSITVISGTERLTWPGFVCNVAANPSDGQTDPPDPWQSWADEMTDRIVALEAGGGGDGTGTCSFDIVDGDLIMTYTDGTNAPSFYINENGYLIQEAL